MKTRRMPEGWKEVELKDLFEFHKKTGRPASEGLDKGKYKFFTSSETQKKHIDNHDFEGPCLIFSTGGKAAVHYCNEKFSSSNDCFVVKINNQVITEYVYYFLRANIQLLERGFKGAGLKHISKEYIKKIKIAFPERKEIQQKIVSILEKVKQTKEIRKEADELTKCFLNAVFMEMFGDPVKNPKKWNIATIEKLVKKEKYSIKRGPFGGALKKEIFVDDGYLVYEQYHALNDDFSFGRYFIDEYKFQELNAFEVFPEDIIISCSGIYLGKLAIVPKNAKKGIINQALLKLSLDQKKYNNFFFTFVFRNENFRNKFFGTERGSGIPNFPPMPTFKQFGFINPPIELQNKFASIVKEVELLKELQKHSKERLDNLFNVLMQKAFKGELII